jgi:hypothetical protein
VFHEQARPAPEGFREPAADTRQEARNVSAERGRVHRFPQIRRRVSAAKSPACPARLYYALISARWGRTGLCFETQKALAKEFGVTVRTIRRWEREIAAAGIWRLEARGRGRQLVLLEGGHPCPPSSTAKADIPGTKADTGGHEGGHGCPPTLKSSINSSSGGAAAAEEGPGPLPAPVAEALTDLEALGVGGSSLARIRPRLQATWTEFGRRGGDADTEFRASWKAAVDQASAPAVRNTAAWLIKVLLDGDGAAGILLRPGRLKAPQPLGAAYQRFVPPNPGGHNGR